MRQIGSVLWPKLRTLCLYGANTDVGKTIFSTILCQAFRRVLPEVYYLKPVSTGPSTDADHAHVSKFAPGTRCNCLYQFSDPVSPHIAARSDGFTITDNTLQVAVYDELQSYLSSREEGIALLETAGGVLSPAPSGSSQADAYRHLRLPVLLLGDHKLGGISTTISSWESLHMRGYEVPFVALFAERRYGNFAYLKEYLRERNVHIFSVEPPPDRRSNQEEETKSMQAYYSAAVQSNEVMDFVQKYLQAHDTRIQGIKDMPHEAHSTIWHPFMQHRERCPESILAIDSAYGDHFQTYSLAQDTKLSATLDSSTSLLRPAFDGSASWWTQGLGHGNPKLALTAANAAGRYGHVMFASAVHEPALTLAKTIIATMGNPRLKKVFYTDNGSTGMEVAVKMALRAAAVRNKWSSADEILILGLRNSYHGDTMGTMDCSEPSIFNQKVEWYRGRGIWFDFPQVRLRQGKWRIEIPDNLISVLGPSREFQSLAQVFDFDSRPKDKHAFRKHLTAELFRLREEGKKLGALILEPVVLGAGGMMLADPLFQHCLVEAVRSFGGDISQRAEPDWSGMPVIFDEVFTGLFRLGRFSAATFLDVDPDIVVNAKLLTGGLVSLCTTTASQAIFNAFLSDDKSDALLHGHSYTAHAVGCAVANESLRTMTDMDQNGCWDDFKRAWLDSRASGVHQHPPPWSMWSEKFISSLSHKAQVEHVWALGSVIAISLQDAAGAGYASTVATGLRDRLLRDDGEWRIHSRVLGNVLYLMAAMTTTPEVLQSIEQKMMAAID